jgi:hypothetical protein
MELKIDEPKNTLAGASYNNKVTSEKGIERTFAVNPNK